MYLHLFILYFSLGILAVVFQFKMWKIEKLSAYSILHASYVLYYIVVPVFLISFSTLLKEHSGKFTHVVYNASIKQELYAFIAIAIAYFVMVLSYFLFNKGTQKSKNISIKKTTNYIAIKYIYIFGIFFLVVGGTAMTLFFIQLGGYRSALRFAETLRFIKTDPANYYGPFAAMFRMLSYLIMGAPYCFKVYFDLTKMKKARVLFWVSFIMTIMYLLFNSGRAPILFFLLPFLITTLIKKNKNVVLVLFVISFIVFFSAEIFDIFLYEFTTGESMMRHQESLLIRVNSIMQNFSFPYASIHLVGEMNDLFGYRYGQDYFLWIFNILPSRIFSVIGINIPNFETMNGNTTAYYFIKNPNSLGGVPTDIITLGLRQFTIPGLVLNIVLFSFLAIYIDKLCRKVGEDYMLILIRLRLAFVTIIPNNDFTAFARTNLFLIILFIMINRVSKKKLPYDKTETESYYENRDSRTKNTSTTY